MIIYHGGCACGATLYQAHAAPANPGYCQCGLCRRATGSAVVLWLDFPERSFHWLCGQPVFYACGGELRRACCAACGSELCTLQGDGQVRISVATLDHAAPVAPRSHVFADYGDARCGMDHVQAREAA